VLCAVCRLDALPLQDLAQRNFAAEVIKYAGGSPLEGEQRVSTCQC
jgi:hypothetical protein